MRKFSDPKIRQAVNYAVDKDALVQIVLAGLGAPAYSFLSLGKYSTDAYGFHYNLDKAKSLMAASTMPAGFKAEYLSKAGDPVASQIGVVLKDQLAKIGLDLTLVELEGGAYSARRSKGDFDMVYKLGTLDIYDSSENLNFDVNTAGFTGWQKSDPNAPAIWALAQAASANPNEAQRAAQFDELQKRYMEAPPMLPLFNPLNAWATSTSVKGYTFLPLGTRPFDLTYLVAK
jgi:peptide/nickel transport system substrate-binding protein